VTKGTAQQVGKKLRLKTRKEHNPRGSPPLEMTAQKMGNNRRTAKVLVRKRDPGGDPKKPHHRTQSEKGTSNSLDEPQTRQMERGGGKKVDWGRNSLTAYNGTKQ